MLNAGHGARRAARRECPKTSCQRSSATQVMSSRDGSDQVFQLPPAALKGAFLDEPDAAVTSNELKSSRRRRVSTALGRCCQCTALTIECFCGSNALACTVVTVPAFVLERKFGCCIVVAIRLLISGSHTYTIPGAASIRIKLSL